jgi:hypothetical protein
MSDFTEEAFNPCPEEGRSGVTLDDFRAYMPMHSYIYVPCREIWPAASVNARLGRVPVLTAAGKPKKKADKDVTIPASAWLDQNHPVEQMTWCPGFPVLIRDRLVVDGGWIERADVTCFNLYRPPRIKPGNKDKAGPWLDHVRKIYPEDVDHIVMWLAHRVQRPQEKINHALVLGGAQGIGKDTLLEPVKQAVGPWNFRDVTPTNLLGRFNSFAKAVILRMSEARDLGDAEKHVNRFDFYEHTKIYTAAPPDVLRLDEKNLREYYVFNVLGFLITTNHKTDGIYLPADDRRHYVAWSNFTKEDFTQDYWNQIWGWYENGGHRHVATFLSEHDIYAFDPKAPPPKTPAFWDIVNASSAPEDAELADLIDKIGNPDALTINQLIAAATGDILDELMVRKNRRAIPHRLERCEYVSVQNPDNKKGLWVLKGERQVIYAKMNLPLAERIKAARELARTAG